MNDESGTLLKPCPECGDDDDLLIDSNGSANCSWVECGCGYMFQSNCYEENIGRHWNKHCSNKIIKEDN